MVAVPEADALVDRWRRDWDSSAALGVPAHVTVLYPFLPAAALGDPTVDAALEELFAGFAPFDYALTEVRRFVPSVVYLAPEPEAPFRELTAATWERWPDYPPYEGEHDDVVPHLTVVDTGDAGRVTALAAEVAIGTEMALPMQLRCAEVTLLHEQSGRWSERRTFRLGG